MRLSEYVHAKKNEIIVETLRSSVVTDFISKNTRELETLFSYSKCAMMEMETKFKVLNEEFSHVYDHNPIEQIKTRMKSVDSLMEKVNRYDIPFTMDAITQNINDIAGVRVICPFPGDIYMLAECLLQQDDVTLVERKDYILHPKDTGYRSLHLIVSVPIFLEHEKRDMKVEVQFRTIAMDFWASLEHRLRYKKKLPPEIESSLADELLECAEISADLDFKMQSIRQKIFDAVQASNESKPNLNIFLGPDSKLK